MSDVDLRKLRNFLVVAEELNLGRAALRLHLAQPALSRQMTALERELGVRLFDRSQRGTTLTPAGGLLMEEARALLLAATALQLRTRQAGSGRRTFRIGFLPAIVLTSTVRRFSEMFPDVQAEVVRAECRTQADILHDGSVDVVIGRLPLERRSLTVLPLYEESRVVAMPDIHPLASHERLVVDDLVPYDMIQNLDSVPEWVEAVAEKRPLALTLGRQDLPAVGPVEQTLEHIAAGYGIAVIPESTAQFYTRPGVVYRYVEGFGPGHVVLAHPSGRSTPYLDAFVEIAQRTLTRRVSHPAPVPSSSEPRPDDGVDPLIEERVLELDA